MAKINTGFAVFGIGAFVWAGIDYKRFIKFWMLRPAPYTLRVRIIFRLFFLASVIGGVWHLVDTIPSERPATFYLTALLISVGWFVVFYLMLRLVEWMNQKRKTRQSRGPQP